jgi:hypothetical protein
MIRAIGPIEPKFIIEEVTDPVEVVRFRADMERFRRDLDWLQKHWAELLPQALGRFVAVAGQEAFIADTAEEAAARAEAAHPEDRGVYVRYVRPGRGPRIYANHRQMAIG